MDLHQTFIEALELAPSSIRALAREAGVPHSSLVRIRQGVLRVTPGVARAVAEALEGWGKRCSGSARGIRSALGEAASGNRETS